MIIYKCDLCKKKVDKVESIILYSKRIDYCKECKEKASRIKRAMQKSIQYYNDELDKQIKEAEENILRRYR